MNANYLTRLRAINQGNARQDGTAQTAKINLRGLCSSPLPHNQQPTTPAPIVGADTTAAPFDDELFQERAAIYEFDAGFSRQEAERRAYLEVTKWMH
jgi:hypothetical protein